MKHAITILMLAALVGCASAPEQFVKGNPTDEAICRAQAQAAAAPIANGFFALDALKDTYRACMLGRGYAVK